MQRCLRAVVLRAVEPLVELVQGLSSLDQCAFGEQSLLDDAADLRPYVGNQMRIGLPGQLAREVDGLGLQRDHGDLWCETRARHAVGSASAAGAQGG